MVPLALDTISLDTDSLSVTARWSRGGGGGGTQVISLSSMVELRLDRNGIRVIPPGICRLKRLQELSMVRALISLSRSLFVSLSPSPPTHPPLYIYIYVCMYVYIMCVCAWGRGGGGTQEHNELTGLCDELFRLPGLAMLKLDYTRSRTIPPAIERLR